MGHPLARDAAHRQGQRTSSWPFMAPIIPPASGARETGVPRRQEIEFHDGTRMWLLRVERTGVADLYLRELGEPAAGALVDLRHVVPDLARELPLAHTRDVPGTVHFALRQHFKSRDAFLEAVTAAGRPV